MSGVTYFNLVYCFRWTHNCTYIHIYVMYTNVCLYVHYLQKLMTFLDRVLTFAATFSQAYLKFA